MKANKGRYANGIGAVIFAVVMAGSGSTASAMAPPADFALQAVGQAADERNEAVWSMTKVGDGIVELCADEQGGDSRRFSGPESQLEARADADEPWQLLWGLLWSEQPAQIFDDFTDDWNERTARVEVVNEAPVYCYGDTSWLCVDESLRRIVVLEVEKDATRWAFRVTGDAEVVHVSRDGALLARVERSDKPCAS